MPPAGAKTHARPDIVSIPKDRSTGQSPGTSRFPGRLARLLPGPVLQVNDQHDCAPGQGNGESEFQAGEPGRSESDHPGNASTSKARQGEHHTAQPVPGPTELVRQQGN